MWSKLFVMIFGLLIVHCNCKDFENMHSFWKEVGFRTGGLIKNCLLTESNRIGFNSKSMLLISCLRKQSVLILQKTLDQDIICLGSSIKLVKWENNTGTDMRSLSTYNTKENTNVLTYDSWKNEIFKIVANVFETHMIKINGEYNKNKNISRTETEEGRGRKKGYMEFYVFSIVALGTVMIPMGFKFLAILGGKAILLAKMALLLASIQGLKKLATSDINYGLYQAPPGWYGYDRKSQENYYQYPEDYYYENYPSASGYPYVKRLAT